MGSDAPEEDSAFPISTSFPRKACPELAEGRESTPWKMDPRLRGSDAAGQWRATSQGSKKQQARTRVAQRTLNGHLPVLLGPVAALPAHLVSCSGASTGGTPVLQNVDWRRFFGFDRGLRHSKGSLFLAPENASSCIFNRLFDLFPLNNIFFPPDSGFGVRDSGKVGGGAVFPES